MNILQRLWRDESGFVISAELILVGTIVVIGMIVGLASLRYAVVSECKDISSALHHLDHSYSYDDWDYGDYHSHGSHYDDDDDDEGDSDDGDSDDGDDDDSGGSGGGGSGGDENDEDDG